MIRMAGRVLAAGAVVLVAAVALQGQASADMVLTGSFFHPAPPTGVDRYSVKVNKDHWNIVSTRGNRYDYDLTLTNASGQSVGSSALASFFIDFVAVNTHGSCAGKAGQYTALATPFAPAPASHGDGADGYVISRKGSGKKFDVLSKSTPDRFSAMGLQTNLGLWEVNLKAGTTYRVAWNTVHTYYEGGIFLLPAAKGTGNCVQSRANVLPLLYHEIEEIDGPLDLVRSGEVRFTATASGWHALILTQQQFDLTRVSIGTDANPHVMIKVA
jgi:hypothetical protein